MPLNKTTQNMPYYQDNNQSTLVVTKNGKDYYKEERDEEEYFYLHRQPNSEEIESVSINFLNDDRRESNNRMEKKMKPIEKKSVPIQTYNQNYGYSFKNSIHSFEVIFFKTKKKICS